MLSSLSIKNYALIEDLHIDFPQGFIVITGETGAGKSILLGALSLVLGKRADLTTLRNSDEKCVIEATFSIGNYGLKPLFDRLDVDYEEPTFLRREILPSGKSRAFINDTPTTLDVLSELGETLVDVHSQHQTMALNETDFQFEIIDSIAKNSELRSPYTEWFKQYKKSQKKLDELVDFQKSANKEYDYNQHLLNELKTAPLQVGIQEQLEETYDKASNSEEIKERMSLALSLLSDENLGIVTRLRELKSVFDKLAKYAQQYVTLSNRINSSLIELEDVQNEVFDINENIDTDPETLNDVSRKLQLIYDLQKKHQVATVDELIELQTRLETLVSQVENIEEEIAEQRTKTQAEHKKVLQIAQQIHESREKSIPLLNKKLLGFMQELGMPDAQFSIAVTPSEKLYANGSDELSFLFSANKGGNFGSLKKVASGGELSRIMLSVKAILAENKALPTIMFDEIDTGVSGDISQKMGDIMKQMSTNRQVFSITHLPQIAAKGNTHFKVFKETINERTTTQLKLLNNQERIDELAVMLGGKNGGESAINHAKELISKG